MYDPEQEAINQQACGNCTRAYEKDGCQKCPEHLKEQNEIPSNDN